MTGYQITFFTQQDRKHHGKRIGEWLLGLAKELHLRGATMSAAIEGVDHAGRVHSAHFFELTDQPLTIVFVMTAEEADQLFSRLEAEKVQLFYVKAPVEFGTIGTQG